MPNYEGVFISCPLCGEPAAAKTIRGDARYVCFRCYGSILAELVLEQAVANPIPYHERLERLSAKVAGTVFAQRVEVKDPRPSKQKKEHISQRDVALKVMDYVNEHAHVMKIHASRVDRELHVRKGTSKPFLEGMVHSGSLAKLPSKGRFGRSLYSTEVSDMAKYAVQKPDEAA
jgi:hypothetical protein